MAEAARKHPSPMTVAEFLEWPGDGTGTRYELVDGVLRAMAPASDIHGTIHSNLTTGISNHLRATRPDCRIVATPGIQPRLRADWNHRIPGLGVTCARNEAGQHMLPDPFLLIEILSPSNADDTWSNIPLYASLPTVEEILIVHSMEVKAEILRRGHDKSWPRNPELIEGRDAVVRLHTIDLMLPLSELCRSTYLATP